jgi:hypothetical protein
LYGSLLHTSEDCIFITEDYGNSREARFINVGRNLSCCAEEEETTECRKGTRGVYPLFVSRPYMLKFDVGSSDCKRS